MSVPKQKISSIALVEMGIFLGGTLAYMIGSAWTNVAQDSFQIPVNLQRFKMTLPLVQSGALPPALDTATKTYHEDLKTAKRKALWYAIGITLLGLVLMVGFILFVQELDPTLVSKIQSG
jgi:hypothetical protein